MIEVESLTKRYPSHEAVSDISFTIERGEVVGFLGPNGAGKSTTLRMLTGFLAPTSGTARIDGISVLERPIEAQRRFGYLPEIVPVYDDMRAYDFLRYRAELKGLSYRAAKREADRVLELAGVVEARDRWIAKLSKGTKQRIGIADALLGDPPILILDEPTVGLDPNQIRHIRRLIKSFEGEKTVFLSTHILPEVEASCSRVVIIRDGKKIAEGDPRKLREEAEGQMTIVIEGPAEPDRYIEAMKDCAPVKSARRGEGRSVEVEAMPGDESLDAIFNAVTAQGLGLRRMERRAASLEEVFVGLTTVEELDS